MSAVLNPAERAAWRAGPPPVLLALALLAPAATAYILWLAPIDGLAADRTALAARDFTVLWGAGRLAATGAWSILADPASLTASLRQLFGLGMPAQLWPYPPTALLLAVPVASIPFGWAFVAYGAAAASLLLATLRSVGFTWPTALAVVFSPAMIDSALAGQNGALTAALLVGGLLALPARPCLAGILLGALVLKPQLGLLLPFCLGAGRNWRALGWAGASAAALIALSIATFGVEPWSDYLTVTPANAAAFAERPWHAGSDQVIFASAFMAARSAGASLPFAYALQLATLGGAAFVAMRLWRDPRFERHGRTAATFALCVLACPWVHSYDMPALAVCIVMLWPHRQRFHSLLGWAWLWPGLLTLIPLPSFLSFATVGGVAYAALCPSSDRVR